MLQECFSALGMYQLLCFCKHKSFFTCTNYRFQNPLQWFLLHGPNHVPFTMMLARFGTSGSRPFVAANCRDSLVKLAGVKSSPGRPVIRTCRKSIMLVSQNIEIQIFCSMIHTWLSVYVDSFVIFISRLFGCWMHSSKNARLGVTV